MRTKDPEQWKMDDPDKPLTIHCEGVASLVPVVEWDRDDYSFRGPIIEVKEVELLEQKGWLVRTIVRRTLLNDIDIDLDILVTHRVWDEDGPPRSRRGGNLVTVYQATSTPYSASMRFLLRMVTCSCMAVATSSRSKGSRWTRGRVVAVMAVSKLME